MYIMVLMWLYQTRIKQYFHNLLQASFLEFIFTCLAHQMAGVYCKKTIHLMSGKLSITEIQTHFFQYALLSGWQLWVLCVSYSFPRGESTTSGVDGGLRNLRGKKKCYKIWYDPCLTFGCESMKKPAWYLISVSVEVRVKTLHSSPARWQMRPIMRTGRRWKREKIDREKEESTERGEAEVDTSERGNKREEVTFYYCVFFVRWHPSFSFFFGFHWCFQNIPARYGLSIWLMKALNIGSENT